MNPRTHVVLIPGFFGFSELAGIPYFDRASTVLREALSARGIDAEVQEVAPPPAASLRERAARLALHLSKAPPGTDLHLIGHSSGGLDARLLVSPASSLQTEVDVSAIASRVRTVTTIATPHYGTPLATFFLSVFGQPLLGVVVVGAFALLRAGRMPFGLVASITALLHRVARGGRPSENAVSHLHSRLLSRLSKDEAQRLESFVADLVRDRGILPQLTPDGMDLFNATTRDRSTVRYASVVARARPPGMDSAMAVGFDAYAQASHAVYWALHAIAARTPIIRQNSSLADEAWIARFGTVPDWRASDGVVPTRAQAWGEIIHGAAADHLDLIGYFSDPIVQPPHFDGFSSASGFSRRDFVELWTSVANTIARSGDTRLNPISPSPEITAPMSTRWAHDIGRKKKDLTLDLIFALVGTLLVLAILRLGLNSDWRTILATAAGITFLVVAPLIVRRLRR